MVGTMEVKDLKGAKITHAGLLKHNADGTVETQKITHAGLVARSPEGTAAKGMNIRGNEDLWVEIQANTFRNWVNEHLRPTGMRVHDWATDFCDGTCLCALVESLQTRPLKPSWNRRPANQHHYLENATTALNAIEKDHIKLVNIGNVDIVNGNVKLILGLIWSLIVRYQIGRSKFPPRKLMLAWLQAALPDCKITNLTTDWNSGVNLAALLDYCKPGLYPHWRSMDPSQSVRNCTHAMNLAQSEFGVPKVLEPEYLASPWLDELSGMTYLSYFMKPGGPGYNATMRWVNTQVREPVKNFTTDWNDGRVMCEIIKGLGGPAPAPEKLSTDRFHYENNVRKAIDAGAKLGIQPVLTAKDMANPEVEHLGIMAYAAHLQWVTPRPPLSDLVNVFLESTSGRVGEQTHFRIDIMSRDISLSSVRALVVSPSGNAQQIKLNAHGEGVYVPDKYGMHEIVVEIGDEQMHSLGGHFFRVLPRFIQVAPPGMAPCALGSLVEVLVNATGAPKTEDILVTAVSPTGISHNCPLKKVEEGHSAIFKPDEAGIWEIAITYQGRHIQGGPFTCAVFDASGVSVHGLDGAMPLRAHSFEVDARGVGVNGELHVDIVHDKRSLVCSVEKIVDNKYRVTFMPRQNGKYRVYVYFNGYDVKGSPFIMRVGTKGRSGKTRSSPLHDNKHRSESPSMHYTSTTSTRHNDYRNAATSSLSRRDLLNHNHNTATAASGTTISTTNIGTNERQRSYSPQYSPKQDTTDYRTSSSYYKRESEIRSSEIRTHSPLTIKTSIPYETTTRNLNASPRHMSASPVQRYSPNSAYITTATHRMSPSTTLNKNGFESRTVEKSSTYKSTSNFVTDSNIRASPSLYGTAERLRRTASPEPRIDHSSNVRVSSMKPASARRDSWDVINKTKHMLSHNSLESLANMTESQLNTDLSYARPDIDNETHRNTQYNKFALNEQKYHSDRRGSRDSVDESERYKPSAITVKSQSNNSYTDKSGGFTRTVKESSQQIVTESSSATPNNGGYSSLSRFRPIESTLTGVTGARAIRVQDIPNGAIGCPVEFEIDGSKAGSGNLEILVNGGRVTSSVRSLGGQRFVASFTPHEPGIHTVQITFNGETVPGSPWHVEIMSTPGITALGESTRLVPANTPAVFDILPPPGQSLAKGECVATVLGPNKTKLNARVTHEAANGAARIEFVPTEVGTHIIEASINGTKISGGPLIAKVYDSSLIQVTDVNGGVVGQPCQFRGQNIPTQVHPQGSARFSVSFVPTEACEHTINVSFNKMPVPGCPITVNISGGMSGPQVSLGGPGPVHQSNSFVINHNGGRLEDIEVNVEGPAGQSVPAQVHQSAEGVFKAEFVPRVVGEHRVHVTVCGLATAGSPYAAKVYDVGAIKVKNVSNGTVGKPVTFLVETSQAGPGNLEVTVNGGRVPTSAQAQGQHTYAISFTPREAQNHTVELRFNGQDVPGSPFTCRVSAAARIQSPETMDKVSVGRMFEFVVESDTKPTVEVLGPARRSVPVKVDEIHMGFNVKFEPVEVGDHSVEVRLPGGGHVEGSPFLLKAYSAEKVVVTDIRPGVVGKSVSFGINASQAGAGNLEIIVAVNGKNVPNFVQSEGNARFKVNFKPTEAAPHSLSVRFNGHPVPGSPFTCQIGSAPVSLPRAIASGEALKQAAIRVDNTFDLDGFEGIEPQVFVTSPSGDNVPVDVQGHGDSYTASFRPSVVGRHLISVTASDQHINGSPFSCNVFDVSRVTISGLEQQYGPAALGIPVTFSVDAAGAGEGTLELVVSTDTSTVKAEVVACARGLYDVTFVPQSTESHYVNITFNEVPVDGSPFRVEIQHTAQTIQIGSLAMIDFPSDDQIAEIMGPDHKPVPYTINRQTAEFRTHMTGNYLIRFIDRETRQHIGTRTLTVFDPSLVKITEVGEALCHRPASISVSLNEAGQGDLSARVKCGATEVPHTIRGPSKNGIYEIVYHPTRVAPHKITILFNDVPISLKPLEINVLPAGAGKEISVSGLGLYQARVGKTTNFAIDTIKRPAREFDVVVSGPGGQALPVRCYQTKSGHLQAEFNINKPGQCIIEVLHQSKPLPGSPFTCEAFDIAKVSVQGVPKSPMALHSPISFSVRTENAGLAELEAFAVSPTNQNVPVHINEQSEGIYSVEFIPTQPGNYKLTLMYGGETLPNSPYTFTASTTGAKNDTRASGNGLEVCHRNKEASFIVYCPVQPNVQIERTDEFGERIEPKIKALGNNEWRISYTILSVGRYEIRASCPNRGNLPGSPWHISCVESSKVTPVGGWGTLLDHEGRLILPARIVFDVENAGPGELNCTIDGIEIPVDKLPDGKLRLFISGENLAPGEHDLDLTWSNLSIVQCPRSAFVTGQQAADKVVLTGRGLAAAQAGEAAHFTIDATDAPAGRPEVILVHQDNTSVPVSLAQPRPNEAIWLASYTPQKSSSGSLTLSVKWNGRLVKGCPLTIAVGSSMDATKVICSGEGLRHGIVGKDIKSWIDTRRAGPGELTAHCAGPRKVAYCELYDHGDATFTLNIKPQEPGRHLLTIKYGGQNVPGSPFALKVAGAPDASKVRVYGPGIEHGVLATFQSRFICDTRGAGAGQLTVRVRGPKGAFRVEMQRESQKDRTILCKFDPTEPGDYRVEVKWAGEFVPGSPFPVMIFDTEEELRRFLQGI
ncbi:Filamin-A [Lucilia cuprina]|nr:Filamin-A [Lucilia cuprina]